MFMRYGGLKDLLPIFEQISRTPGRLLIEVAAGASLLSTGLGYLVLARSDGPLSWLPLAFGILGIVVTAFFGWRRHQLQTAVEKWKSTNAAGTTTSFVNSSDTTGQEVIVLDESGTELPRSDSSLADPELQRQREAQIQSSNRRETWMPGVEAAQRAAIAAAGGTANAPYLKPDLRVTLVSAIATMLAIPISTFFAIVALISLV